MINLLVLELATCGSPYHRKIISHAQNTAFLLQLE